MYLEDKKLPSLIHWVHQIRSLHYMTPNLAKEIAINMIKDMDLIEAEEEVRDGEARLAYQQDSDARAN